jgi:hypothetical protein
MCVCVHVLITLPSHFYCGVLLLVSFSPVAWLLSHAHVRRYRMHGCGVVLRVRGQCEDTSPGPHRDHVVMTRCRRWWWVLGAGGQPAFVHSPPDSRQAPPAHPPRSHACVCATPVGWRARLCGCAAPALHPLSHHFGQSCLRSTPCVPAFRTVHLPRLQSAMQRQTRHFHLSLLHTDHLSLLPLSMSRMDMHRRTHVTSE